MPVFNSEFPTAVCRLCGNSFRISPEEDQFYGYPPHPCICSRCSHFIAVEQGYVSNDLQSKITNDSHQSHYYDSTITEGEKNEYHDQKPELDDSPDARYEEQYRKYETDYQSCCSEEEGHDGFQAEAKRQIRIRFALLVIIEVILD